MTRASFGTGAMMTLAALAPVTARAEPAAPPNALVAPDRDAACGETPGLDPDEVAELRDGRGRSQARVAEVLGHPGPRHVLEAWSAGQLPLADAQVARIRQIAAAMTADAQRAGGLVLGAERELALAFRDGRIDEPGLRTRVGRIAELRGELRAVHLRAHLATRALLDPAQLARYAALRGHAPGAGPHRHGH